MVSKVTIQQSTSLSKSFWRECVQLLLKEKINSIATSEKIPHLERKNS